MAGRSSPMPAKSSPELVARFGAVPDGFPEVERRKMFGFPAAFVGGNLATGLFGEGWMVRLRPAAALEAIAAGLGAPFEPMPGRAMTGYVLLPAEAIRDDAAIATWVARAIDFTRGLPAKG